MSNFVRLQVRFDNNDHIEQVGKLFMPSLQLLNLRFDILICRGGL